jgi:hypothetical protein
MLCGSRAGSIGVSRAVRVPEAEAPVAVFTKPSAGRVTCAGDCGAVSVAAAFAAKVCAGAAGESRTVTWLVALARTSATPNDLAKLSARTLTTTRAAAETSLRVKLPSADVCVVCAATLTLALTTGWPSIEDKTLPEMAPVTGAGGGSCSVSELPPPPQALNMPNATLATSHFKRFKTACMSLPLTENFEGAQSRSAILFRHSLSLGSSADSL